MEKTINAIIGVGGLAASQVASEIDPTQISDIAKAIAQIAILIVTLFGLFRKRKSV